MNSNVSVFRIADVVFSAIKEVRKNESKSESQSRFSPEKSIDEMSDSIATLEGNISADIKERTAMASPGS